MGARRSKGHFQNPKRRGGRNRSTLSGMQAAPVARFPLIAADPTGDLYKRVVKLAEEDPAFGLFDSEQACTISNRMVELFLDVKQLSIQDVEERINALFGAAMDELWMEFYEGDPDIVDAKNKTEEALRKAYRSITT